MARRDIDERKAISDSKAKGQDIEVLKYIDIEDARLKGITEVLVPLFGGEEYCGGVDDILTVLEERNESGEFVALRRPCGTIKREAIIQSDVTDEGLKMPAPQTEANPNE